MPDICAYQWDTVAGNSSIKAFLIKKKLGPNFQSWLTLTVISSTWTGSSWITETDLPCQRVQLTLLSYFGKIEEEEGVVHFLFCKTKLLGNF